jgi:aminotransferase/cystathionine beta-lyase
VDRDGVGASKWLEMKAWNPNVQKGIIPFSVADMEFKNPPEIINGLKEYLDQVVLGYTMPTDDYFNTVVNWMKRRHDWIIKPDWFVTSNGIITAFFHAVNAFTEPGDGVLVMTPVYYPFYEAIARNKRQTVRNPLIYENNSYTIDFDDLERKAKDPRTKLILFCSPHNPVGRVWTKEELEKVGRICIDNNVMILADEIHHDLIMPGYKHTAFASISEEFAQHCITCTAPSKTFNLAGLHASNNIIPNPKLKKRYEDHMLQNMINIKLNMFAYKACELAYSLCEDWLNQLIPVIAHNSKIVHLFFKEQLPQVTCTELEGTYLQWMDFRALNIDHLELERMLHMEAQVFFDEGYVFGDEGKGFERINIACPSKPIEDALQRLEKTVRKHMRA